MRGWKWGLAAQFVGLALATAMAQLPNCPLRPDPGSVVLDPQSLSSQSGSLELSLVMQNGVDAAGYGHYCYNYSTSNGIVEAPTLRLNPGDTLTLNLTNKLTATLPAGAQRVPSMKDMDMSAPIPANPCQGGPVTLNTTNVHFHGLNVPPVCHQDEVVNTLIQPGTPSFQYKVQIPPDEPPGLYWYHPHPHGFSTLQVNGGATGAIIINGIEKIKPQVAGLTERVLIIRQQFLNPLAWVPGAYQLTLNFQPALAPLSHSPIIQMKPGERQFWRVANSTSQAFLALQLLFAGKAQNLELISLDGVPVAGDPIKTTIDLPPAGRAEFIVTGPPAGSKGVFITAGFDTGPVGNPNNAQVLADIVATTAAIQGSPTVTPSAPVPVVTQRFSGLAAIKPTSQRKLYFAEAPLGTNPPVNFFLVVDGQQPRLFHANDAPAIVTNVGAVEDWTIENRTSEEHAFHMHQIHFLVTAIDGIPVTNPDLQDTVNVPFWSGSGPFHKVTVRMDFRDPNIAGTFVFHCHVLFHEDGGMMGKILVKAH